MYLRRVVVAATAVVNGRALGSRVSSLDEFVKNEEYETRCYGDDEAPEPQDPPQFAGLFPLYTLLGDE